MPLKKLNATKKGSSRNFVESWDWQGEVRRVMCRDDAKSGRPLRVITWFDVTPAVNGGRIGFGG
jgi:hypothetical protein